MDIRQNIPNKRQIACPLIWAILSSTLLLISLIVDFQREAIKEHVRFRKGFPSRSAWENPPDGSLNCYLYNVTNTEAFLNETDKKLHLQQIGPIVYRIKVANVDLKDNEKNSTLTFRKLRTKEFHFDEAKSPPGIMNQKIYMPNVVLLSVVSKMHDWMFLARNAFSAYAASEPIFLERTINEFLWNYTTPLIENVRPYWPGVVDNVGMLYNAFREFPEVYEVNIGTQNGLENFFKIRTLNNKTVFSNHYSKANLNPETCPIHVANSFDNTLFPPYLKRDDHLSIVAGDSCRTLPLVYDGDVSVSGYHGYKFIISDDGNSSCLNNSMGIPLPAGVFDASGCRFDVPSAYSQPHFFGSSYDYEKYFEGLSPNAEEHQTIILIEPKTGIPFEEKYRFQANIPIPNLTGFNQKIKRFNGMMVPLFWYEYDLDDLPTTSGFILKIIAYYLPYIQKLCIVVFLLAAVYSFTTIACRIYRINLTETLWLGQREMKQTISEVPTRDRYFDDTKSFLPKIPSKV